MPRCSSVAVILEGTAVAVAFQCRNEDGWLFSLCLSGCPAVCLSLLPAQSDIIIMILRLFACGCQAIAAS